MNSDFNLDILFGDNNNEVEVIENKLTDFQNLTLLLLEKAKLELSKWLKKEYKKTEGSVYVGSELDGGEYSFNYINNKRKSNAIKNAKSDIELYTKDLLNSGCKF